MIKWFKTTPRPASFENHTLILPAVSVGNVGQLTIDLVLENTQFEDVPKKIGQIFHPGLEPVVANNIDYSKETPGGNRRKKRVAAASDVKLEEKLDADDQCNNNSANLEPNDGTPDSKVELESKPVVDDEKDCLMTACEIYHCPKKEWVVLQFHSAVRKRDRQKFLDFLLNWVAESSFKMVVCFSSIFASERLDSHITGVSPRIQVLYTDKVGSSYLAKVKSFGWNRLLSPSLIAKSPPIQPLKSIEENLTTVNLSGSGITKELLVTCQTNGIPCLTLMVYASDGDNTVDAIQLYKESSHLFQFTPQPRFGDPPSKIRIPFIWRQHLGVNPKFGPDDEDGITILPSGSSGSRRKTEDNPPNSIF